MSDTYQYIGTEVLTVVYGGMVTSILPQDIIKPFYVPFFKKVYPNLMKVIVNNETYDEVEPVIENEVTIINEILFAPPLAEPVELPNPIINSDEEKPVVVSEEKIKKYPYQFKDKILKSVQDIKFLYKEEVQSLAIELGISSDGKKSILVNKINKLLLG